VGVSAKGNEKAILFPLDLYTIRYTFDAFHESIFSTTLQRFIKPFNPDTVKWKGKAFKPAPDERIDLLTDVLKDELVQEKNTFQVKLMQLWFVDNPDEYTPCKTMDITSTVTI